MQNIRLQQNFVHKYKYYKYEWQCNSLQRKQSSHSIVNEWHMLEHGG